MGGGLETRLTNVDGWVDALADVHANVGAQDLKVPGESVKLHLGHGAAWGVRRAGGGGAATRRVGGERARQVARR